MTHSPAFPVAPARARAAALLGAVGIAILVAFSSPFCGKDGVENPQAFVDATKQFVANSSATKMRQGDIVVVHPPWRNDIADALNTSGVLPGGVRASEAFAPRHAATWGRVWFVIDTGAPDLPRVVLDRIRQHTVEETSKDGIRIVVVDDRTSSSSELGSRIAEAKVTVETPTGAITRCKWSSSKNRHVCPGLRGWMHVGRENVTVAGKTEQCIWAHPMTGGKVRVRWENIVLGDRVTLSHALADSALKNAKGAPVTASVLVGGTVLGRDAKQNRRGFSTKRFAVPTGKRATLQNIEVEVTTRNDGSRHYCFRLESGPDEAKK